MTAVAGPSAIRADYGPARERSRTVLPLVVWQAAWRVSPGRTLALTVWCLWSGLQAALLAVALGQLVSRVGVEGRSLLWPALTITGLLVGQVLLSAVASQLSGSLSWRLERAHAGRLVVVLTAPRPLAELEHPEVAADLETARGEGHTLNAGVAVGTLMSQGSQLVLAVTSAALLVSIRWWAPLLLIPGLLLLRSWLAQETRIYREGLEASGGGQQRASYFRSLALQPASAREIRTFNLTEWLISRLTGHLNEGLEHVRQRRAAMVPRMLLTGAVLVAGYGVLGALAVDDARTGSLSIGALLVLLQAAFGLLSLAGGLEDRQRFTRSAAPFAALNRATTWLDSRSQALQRARSGAVGTSTPDQSLRSGPLIAKGLGFAYPGRERILENVSFEVPAGGVLAVVGANGAGKSTLMRLLAGLDEPSSGRLLVGDRAAGTWSLSDWRRKVAFVPQHFMRWELSVRDNVQFGCPHQTLSDAEIWSLLRQAGAAEMLTGHPAGLETVLSRTEPGGLDLSGGQWQRLAMARALAAVHAGASLLILDEPTASLDVRGETEFYTRFLSLTGGVTTILVSHRYSTVQLADQIVVIEDGRVGAAGSHADLLRRSAWYARMVQQQTRPFQEAAPAQAMLMEETA